MTKTDEVLRLILEGLKQHREIVRVFETNPLMVDYMRGFNTAMNAAEAVVSGVLDIVSETDPKAVDRE